MKRIVIALVSACAAALPAARTLDVSAVDSRYLADADGRTFVPVGCNICFDRLYGTEGNDRAACEARPPWEALTCAFPCVTR